MKAKLFLKQAWLWAKKFWWAIIIVLLFIGAALVSALSHIHNTEVDEKNRRLEQHLQEKDNIQRKFEEEADKLDKTKEEELKKLVDESYNDPEKLAREIADAFGLENG